MEPTPSPGAARRGGSSSERHAAVVALGILLSRLAGLVRQRAFAHYFGAGPAADAFSAAFRIPNFLQNLFGEGVLSASFIPVYASLLARGDTREADRTAGAIFALLAVVVSVLVLGGVLLSPVLVDWIAPGFEGATREWTVRLVRILFPGTGLLVLSAWCLGVLNSHRRFFLSYAAPVVWNAAMIATLLVFGGRVAESPGGDGAAPAFDLAVWLAWGAVAGSLLQLLVQLPVVARVARDARPRIARPDAHVRTVLRNFGPVFVGRGVIQISGYVDAVLATLLPTGAVAALVYAQIVYTLPVSLFGMSVSAAELPAMSGARGNRDEIARQLRERLSGGLRRIAFFVVPSAAAFLTLGDVIAAALYQTGRFGRGEAVWTWGILAAYAVGLLPTTTGRLYASAFYALQDTRTPLRYAIVRVVLATGLGIGLALKGPEIAGVDARWGVAGIALASAIAGWVEMILLRRGLGRRLSAPASVPASVSSRRGSDRSVIAGSGSEAEAGPPALEGRFLGKLVGSAAAGAAVAWGVRLVLPDVHPWLLAAATLVPFGGVYLAGTVALGIEEARGLLRRGLQR